MYNAHSLYKLKGRWIQLPDPLLASKWIHLVDQFQALPCNALWNNRFAATTAVRAMIKMTSLHRPNQ